MGQGRQSIFVSGPNDALATPDVYSEQTSTLPLNMQKPLTDIGNALKGLVGQVDDQLLGKITGDIIRGDIRDKAYAMNVFKSAFPNVEATANQLKGSLLNSIAGSIGMDAAGLQSAYDNWGTRIKQNPTEILFKQFPQARLIMDGVEKIKTIKDIRSASGLASILGEVTGDSSLAGILNLDAQFKSVGALIETASAYGVTEFIDTAIKSLREVDRPKAERIAAASAAKIGDLPLLKQYVDADASGELLSEHPNIVNTLMANYHYSAETPFPTIAAANELANTLNQLKPDWFEKDGRKTLASMVIASNDALAELSMLDEYRPLAMSAQFYRIQNYQDIVRDTMSWAAL